MAPRTKTGASNTRTTKTSDSTAAKPQEQAAQAPAQSAQVKPASDPTPAGANTCGKVCPQTSTNPNSSQKKTRTKAERDADIAKYEKERNEAIARGDKDAAWEAEYKAAQVADEYKSLGSAGQDAGGIIGTILGGWMGKGRGRTNPRNTGASPAPAPASTPAPPTAPKPTTAPAPPPANATARTANGRGGGYSKARVKQNPHKDCGKKLPYNDTESVKGTGLEKDHTPSSAALKKAAMDRMAPLVKAKKLTEAKAKTIANRVANNAPTIAIPPDVHAEGDTYKSGQKGNNPEKIEADSKDLNGAAKRNTEKISDSMANKKHGCSEAYNKAAKEITDMDWDKYVDDIISQGIKGK
jgi:hypothetical protein